MTKTSKWPFFQYEGLVTKDNTVVPRRVSNKRITHQVLSAIKTGKLVRSENCEKCKKVVIQRNGKSDIRAHHPNYNKPLYVMWLCEPCHRDWHRKYCPVPEGTIVRWACRNCHFKRGFVLEDGEAKQYYSYRKKKPVVCPNCGLKSLKLLKPKEEVPLKWR